jgi:acyl-CoA thioesterase-2
LRCKLGTFILPPDGGPAAAGTMERARPLTEPGVAVSKPLDRLIDLLDLEPLEVNIYRGGNRDIGSGRVFGGQVLAQALVAARRTVEEPREAHSLHGYFILPGDVAAPIVYFVDRLRDGRSFTTRRVTAIQHGRAIFNLAVSFQVAEEGLVHQPVAPRVPPPESLQSELDLIRDQAHLLPAAVRALHTEDQPIDFRPIDPVDPFAPRRRDPAKQMWFRAEGEIEGPPSLHQAVLAYASDYGLLSTALMPHGLSLRSPNLQIASLDHSLWFHREFRADDWLLYSIDSPTTGGARGFTRGSIFNRAGELVASVAQEGLVRMRN